MKLRIRVGIPETIQFNLLPPELSVLLRPRSMLGAAVPEAPINEYGDPQPRKGDVRDPTRFLQNF
jgi:hypothetical protein